MNASDPQRKPSYRMTLGALVIGLAPSVSLAQGLPDLSNWQCRYCPQDDPQTHGHLEFGMGHASSDSAWVANRHGGPTQPDRSGILGWFDGTVTHDNDNRYLHVRTERIGLDNPILQLDVGQQGLFGLSMIYQELPDRPRPDGSTPFLGVGESRLGLPANWVRGGSTSDMPALESSLQPLRPGSERRWLNLNGTFVPSTRWNQSFDYRRETREGIRLIGATVLTQASIIAQPIDYITDNLELATQYHSDTWLARLAYEGSLFRNAEQALNWANPYTPLTAGSESAALALPPDNQFHRISLSGQYFGVRRLAANANITVGRMEQNDELLPATVNPALQQQAALPRRSADAHVNTVSSQIRARLRTGRRLSWEIQHRYHSRRNQTPTANFVQVQTDAALGTVRATRPYSFSDNTSTLRANYRPARRTRLRLGVEHNSRERELQNRRRTEETEVYGQLRMTVFRRLSVNAHTGVSNRNGSAFESLDPTQHPEEVHQPAFNLANRHRWNNRLRLDLAAGAAVNLGVQGQLSAERYDDSEVGLQSARRLGVSADASTVLNNGLVASIHVNHSRARFEQAGSAQFTAADWWGRSDDRSRAAGVSLEQPSALPNVDLLIDYQFSASAGQIAVQNEAFPDLNTRLHTARADATYHWRPAIDWTLRYRYQRYVNEDWQRDGSTGARLPNLLDVAIPPLNSVDHLISLSVGYHF